MQNTMYLEEKHAIAMVYNSKTNVQYLYSCATIFHRTRDTRQGSEFIRCRFTFRTGQGCQQG